jgi:hypothetical protein
MPPEVVDNEYDIGPNAEHTVDELGGWFLFLKYALPYILGLTVLIIGTVLFFVWWVAFVGSVQIFQPPPLLPTTPQVR